MLALVVFVILTLLHGESKEFTVNGRIYCPLDGPDEYTTGWVMLLEYDALGRDDFMGEAILPKNKSFSIFFSETEAFDLRPFLIFKHDCHTEIRKDRNRHKKSRCIAVSDYEFKPPEGDVIDLEVDLVKHGFPRLLCDYRLGSLKKIRRNESRSTTQPPLN